MVGHLEWSWVFVGLWKKSRHTVVVIARQGATASAESVDVHSRNQDLDLWDTDTQELVQTPHILGE